MSLAEYQLIRWWLSQARDQGIINGDDYRALKATARHMREGGSHA